MAELEGLIVRAKLARAYEPRLRQMLRGANRRKVTSAKRAADRYLVLDVTFATFHVNVLMLPSVSTSSTEALCVTAIVDHVYVGFGSLAGGVFLQPAPVPVSVLHLRLLDPPPTTRRGRLMAAKTPHQVDLQPTPQQMQRPSEATESAREPSSDRRPPVDAQLHLDLPDAGSTSR